MGTIAEKLQKLLATKDAIKTAIINKGQSVTDSDTFASYADKISAIQAGVDTSDATAYATDIRSGKIAYGKRGRIVGMAATVEAATPTITISDAGVITAASTQSDGFVTGSTKTATYQMSTSSLPSITPSAQAQTFQTKGTYSLSDITVSGDANLKPENIKNGVQIFGVTGTAKGSETVIGTYTGTVSVSDTTPQQITLGFRPKFVLVSSEDIRFDAMAPWYYYQDEDVDGTVTYRTYATAAYAFDGAPMYASDADRNKISCLEITDNGFQVTNGYYKYKLTNGNIRNATVYMNEEEAVYHYLAIP